MGKPASYGWKASVKRRSGRSVPLRDTTDKSLKILDFRAHQPYLYRSTQQGCQGAPDLLRRSAIGSLHPPRHEAVWPDEHGSARCDSVGCSKAARWIRQAVLADLVNLKMNAQRFGPIARRFGPGIAFRPRQQGEVSAEQVECRNLFAAPLQPKMRRTRPR